MESYSIQSYRSRIKSWVCPSNVRCDSNKNDYREIQMGRTCHNDSSLVSAVDTGLAMSAVQLLTIFFFIGSSLAVLKLVLKKDHMVGSSNYGAT